MHQHKAVKEKAAEAGWTSCVTPHQCADHPQRQAAHGGIVRRDTCSCGAYRLTEINGGALNYGAWTE